MSEEIKKKVEELNERGIYFIDTGVLFLDEMLSIQQNSEYTEKALERFQLADWLEELLQLRMVKDELFECSGNANEELLALREENVKLKKQLGEMYSKSPDMY